MKWTISRKVVALIVIVVALTTTAIFLPVAYYTSELVSTEAESSIKTTHNVISGKIADTKRQLMNYTVLCANDEDITTLMAARDIPGIARYAEEAMKRLNADLITITDEKGVIIGRGHSKKTGDSGLNQATVQSALKGQESIGMVSGAEIPFSLRAGAPVYHEGRLVGTLAVGISLSNEVFVDELKNLTGTEITIFKGNVRAMTTLTQNGTRIIGTPMETPVVLKNVLEDGKVYIVRNTIMGNEYQSVYWPILDVGGKPVGMWYAGRSITDVRQAEKRVLVSSLSVVAVLLPLLLVLAWLAARVLSKPIIKTKAFAELVAAGRLEESLEVKTSDEIGSLADALRSMVGNLKEKISEANRQTELAAQETEKANEAVLEAQEARKQAEMARKQGSVEAAERLSGIVEEVSAVVEQLLANITMTSQIAETQRDKVNSSASAMEEMNASVSEVAGNAFRAADASRTTKETALAGHELVDRVIVALNTVQENTLRLREEMGGLGAQTEAIGSIVTVISDIADQTNLLALNAAIEAARAGDAGRGFAVVADEVRKLAEKTVTATKEVGPAIAAIQHSTRNSIEAMDAASANVDSTRTVAADSGKALSQILNESEATASQVENIAAAAKQQEVASSDIARSLESINGMALETNNAMEKSRQDTDTLSRQVLKLQDLIRELGEA